MTAYTPYQAEASQGALQLIYEYQTMMASLMAMEVSNASLYDGACAWPKPRSWRATTKKEQSRVLVPRTVHPHYLQAVRSLCGHQGLIFDLLDIQTMSISREVLQTACEAAAAMIIPVPDFLGELADVDMLTNMAHAHKCL